MLWRTDIAHLRDENERLFGELERVQQRFQRTAARMWRIQEEERRRLARELHDELGQALTALVHRLEGLQGTERDACVELARNALADVRELSRLLRPPVLDDLGLGAALLWLARRTREHTGLAVRVDAPASLGPVPSDLETLLFRIAQEALTNVTRHADARSVEMRLHRLGDRIELRIRDDGCGFDTQVVSSDPDRGVGLAAMQDRVALFDGTLALVSAPGRGTTVTVSLCIREER